MGRDAQATRAKWARMPKPRGLNGQGCPSHFSQTLSASVGVDAFLRLLEHLVVARSALVHQGEPFLVVDA